MNKHDGRATPAEAKAGHIDDLIRELHKNKGRMGGLTNTVKQKEIKLLEDAESLELLKDEISKLRWRNKEIRFELQELDPNWMARLK